MGEGEGDKLARGGALELPLALAGREGATAVEGCWHHWARAMHHARARK